MLFWKTRDFDVASKSSHLKAPLVPYPTTPLIVLSALSSTSFSVQVSGSDAGSTNRVFYQPLDNPGQAEVTGPTLVGNGTLTVTGAPESSHLLVLVVSDNGSSFSLPAQGFLSLLFPSTLLESIKDRWYNTPSLTSLITGGLYLSQIPDTSGTQRIDPPYATCDSDRTRFEWTETKLFYEITTVEFHIYNPGSANTLEQMLSEIQACFNWQSVTFTDGKSSSSYIQPLEYYYAAEPIRWRDDSLMYSACMKYEFWINRTFDNYQ